MEDVTQDGNGSTEAPQLGIDIASMIPRLTAEIGEEIKRKATERFSWTIQEAMRKAVEEYIAKNITPLLLTELQAYDTEIRAQMVAAIKGSVDLVAAQMIENTKKKLANYDGDKFVEKVIRSMFDRPF